MKPILAFIGMSLFFFSCTPEKKVEEEFQQPAMRIWCEAPAHSPGNFAVYWQVYDQKIKLAAMEACQLIHPKTFKKLNIPESASKAVGDPPSSIIYIVEESDRIMNAWQIKDGQAPTQIGSYQEGTFRLRPQQQ